MHLLYLDDFQINMDLKYLLFKFCFHFNCLIDLEILIYAIFQIFLQNYQYILHIIHHDPQLLWIFFLHFNLFFSQARFYLFQKVFHIFYHSICLKFLNFLIFNSITIDFEYLHLILFYQFLNAYIQFHFLTLLVQKSMFC